MKRAVLIIASLAALGAMSGVGHAQDRPGGHGWHDGGRHDGSSGGFVNRSFHGRGGPGWSGYRSAPRWGGRMDAYPPPSAPGWSGRGWRGDEQDEARQGVRGGRFTPLGRVIEGIGRRTPGRQLDAGLEYQDGRAVYRVLWMTDRGRRMDYIVDAETGRILGVE